MQTQNTELMKLFLAGKLMKQLQKLGLKKEIGEITIGDLILIARELSNEQH